MTKYCFIEKDAKILLVTEDSELITAETVESTPEAYSAQLIEAERTAPKAEVAPGAAEQTEVAA